MSVLYVKIVNIRWRLGATPPGPLVSRDWGFHPQAPGGVPLPPFPKSLGAPLVMTFVTFLFQSSAALGFKIFSSAALHAKSLPTPGLEQLQETLQLLCSNNFLPTTLHNLIKLLKSAKYHFNALFVDPQNGTMY